MNRDNIFKNLQSAATRMHQLRTDNKNLRDALKALGEQARLAEQWRLCAIELATATRSGTGYRISQSLENFDRLNTS
jgi:hypothetical protein